MRTEEAHAAGTEGGLNIEKRMGKKGTSKRFPARAVDQVALEIRSGGVPVSGGVGVAVGVAVTLTGAVFVGVGKSRVTFTCACPEQIATGVDVAALTGVGVGNPYCVSGSPKQARLNSGRSAGVS